VPVSASTHSERWRTIAGRQPPPQAGLGVPDKLLTKPFGPAQLAQAVRRALDVGEPVEREG